MPKFSKGVVRLLGALALVALVTPAGTSWVTGASGREFNRCIHACNDIKSSCNNGCSDQCFADFPNNKPQRDACIAACRAICLVQSDDCKLECQAIHNPPSPTEP